MPSPVCEISRVAKSLRKPGLARTVRRSPMNDRVAAAGAAAGSLVTRSGYGRLSAGGSSRRASRTLPVADDLGPGIFQLLVADDTSPVQVIELGKPLLDGLRGRRRLIELVQALGEHRLEPTVRLVPCHAPAERTTSHGALRWADSLLVQALGAYRASSPRMNFSTASRASSSLYCSGGDFMKYDAAETTGPPMPRSLAIFAARTASMITPAEFGESQTSSLYSRFRGVSPNDRPSSLTYAHLRSSSHGTWSDGPMCTSALAISCGICEVTDWVLEIFLDWRRLRSSMFMKSMLPPKLSWYVRSSSTPRSSNNLAMTRCVIVAPTWDLMSSPMIGTPACSKRRCQYGSRAMNTGMQFTNAQPAASTCSAYHF